MITTKFTESSFENAFLQLFDNKHKEIYRYVCGYNIHRQAEDVLLKDDFKDYLFRRYPDLNLNDYEIDKILNNLETARGTSVYESMNKTLEVLRNGYTLDRSDLGLPSVFIEYFDYDVASGVNMDVDTRVNNFLVLVRIFLNPSQKYKWYIPLAVGLGHVMTGIDMQPEESFHYTGFSGHIGLGLERLLNKHWSLAAELRYNHNQFHNTQTNARGENYRVYPKLNYFSLSVRTDYRF